MPKSKQLPVSLNEEYRAKLDLIKDSMQKKTYGQVIRELIDRQMEILQVKELSSNPR